MQRTASGRWDGSNVVSELSSRKARSPRTPVLVLIGSRGVDAATCQAVREAGHEPLVFHSPDLALAYFCGRGAEVAAAVLQCEAGGTELLRRLRIVRPDLPAVLVSRGDFDGEALRLLAECGGVPVRLSAVRHGIATSLAHVLGSAARRTADSEWALVPPESTLQPRATA